MLQSGMKQIRNLGFKTSSRFAGRVPQPARESAQMRSGILRDMTRRNASTSVLIWLLLAGCAPPADTPTDGVDGSSSDAATADSDAGQAAGGTAIVDAIADRYYAHWLERLPEAAYFAAVEVDRHDHSPAALAADRRVEDALLTELEAVDIDALAGTPQWIVAALLEQELRAAIATRVCRHELWNVNQMGGWHLALSQVAGLQPVDTPELREQALARWTRFAAFAAQQEANLRAGLARGYSAPKPVVRRVISQLDGMLALPDADSPFASPAVRADDEAFKTAFLTLVSESVVPALTRYRDFLVNEYLDAARANLSITANPGGRACYEASLLRYTTLARAGKDVYALGKQTVAENRARVVELGSSRYGSDDFAEIIRTAKADPADHFADKEELLAFSRDAVRRAEAEMPNWVLEMPQQAVEVVPFPEHEEGTGRSAHYRRGNAGRAAEYRIPLHRPEDQSRGNAEATAFHETWPGHHLQNATAQAVDGLHPVSKIIWFSGPGEGWARYSEALAEEMGLYTTETGPILRRAWPARGMVADPGIHLFGWNRQQAIEYMTETGRFPVSMGDQMVDRIAILPGQLTAYDSGGLEILALRRQAAAALGDSFDIREFHQRVLENGTIPLTYLRRHVEAWIEQESASP